MELTKREQQILKLFCYRNDEIANILTIETSTVKNHVHNILQKLKESTKIRALIKAIKMGIINVYSIETYYKDIGFWDKHGKYQIKMEKIIDGKTE